MICKAFPSTHVFWLWLNETCLYCLNTCYSTIFFHWWIWFILSCPIPYHVNVLSIYLALQAWSPFQKNAGMKNLSTFPCFCVWIIDFMLSDLFDVFCQLFSPTFWSISVNHFQHQYDGLSHLWGILFKFIK